ncbi:MAG: hypothetical protein U0S36_10755 [Candidatus Nanopelagicales bacterium]
MSAGARRSGRVVRPAWAAVVAVAGTAVGLLGHALGGGSPDGVVAALLPALLVGLVAGLVVSTVAWTTPRVALALAAQQVLAHGLSWLGSRPTSVHPRLEGLVAADPHAGHDHLAALTPRMVLAHALVAVVVGAALVPAERAARLLVSWLLRLVPAASAPVLPGVPRLIAVRAVRLPVPRLVHLCVMRGHAPPGVLRLG